MEEPNKPFLLLGELGLAVAQECLLFWWGVSLTDVEFWMVMLNQPYDVAILFVQLVGSLTVNP